MKQIRNYPKAVGTKKAERSVEQGHPWIYDKEILSMDD